MQYRCLGLCIIQSVALHTVHLICGSSSIKHIGSFKGILSSTPVELTGGVEDIDTAFMEIGPVGAVVEVAVPVVVMGITISCWEVGGPPFNNDARSVTTSGSLTVFYLSLKGCSIVDGILSPIG